MNALELKNVSFSYCDDENILHNVNLALPIGSVTAIKGSSGCGKSTLAMISCGVIPNALSGNLTGSVLVFGESISGKKLFEIADKISMVFQDPECQLFAPTVIDEVAFAPENLCYESKIINEMINHAVESAGMADYLDYPPDKLSGGQKQLTALASIMSLDPRIIILDEVASQIDSTGLALIRKAIIELKNQGKTIVIIEHKDVFKDLYDKQYLLKEGLLCELAKGFD